MKKIVLYLLIILFCSFLIQAGCSKDGDVQHVDPQSLKATWRVEAFRWGRDSTNSNAWQRLDYGKVQSIYDIYCVYDSRVNQSFLSKINCAYDETATSSIGVESSGCAKSVFRQDTTWMQRTKNDISFSDGSGFNWTETFRFSRHINLVHQPCSSISYVPETEVPSEVTGHWSLNEASGIITVDYSPSFSRLDGQQVNQFRITSFTGNTLSIKLIGVDGDELKLQKL